jgi:hypothetical protein
MSPGKPDAICDSQLAAAENAFIRDRLKYLVRGLRSSFPTAWDDVLTEQAEDTLLEFLAKVRRGIWPVLHSLDAHLRQAAWRNVRDQLQAAARRRAHEARYARELPHLTELENVQFAAATERVLMLAQNEAEREALRRWFDGEHPVRIAEALGVLALPPVEQLREVKRFKDRIKKRAMRIN